MILSLRLNSLFIGFCCLSIAPIAAFTSPKAATSSGAHHQSIRQKTVLSLDIPSVSELLEQPTSLAVPAATAAGVFLFSSSVATPASLISEETLSEILEGTFLEGKNVECVYKGSKNGFSAVDFHQEVDERGSSLIVARTLTGKVFGGYNPVGWRSTDDYFLSNAAFLWCKGPGNKILKYPIQSGSNAAIFDYATSGPNFGSTDLQIGPPKAAIMGGFAGPDMEDVSSNAGSLRQCRASPGLGYETDGRWPVRGTTALVEVEAYCQKF